MTDRCYVQEAATLAPKKSDGTYPVVIITEGTGSKGVYSDELLQGSAHVFEGTPSFINHPVDPEAPHERDLNSIAGRITNVTVGEDRGKTALLATFKPRAEYAALFEEFSDIIGLSIFCGAYGEKDDTGRVVVEAFDETDAYRSVDAVVAAGRGGRFKRAEESLRTIESSLGTPQGNKPGATAAPGEKERNMEIEKLVTAVEALTASLAPVVSFVAEQKAAADAAVAEAEAKAAAAEQEKDAAIESYSAAVKAVAEAKLLPSQESEILAAAVAGKDIAPLVESAKKVIEEAKSAVAEKVDGYVIESKGRASKGFALTGGSR